MHVESSDNLIINGTFYFLCFSFLPKMIPPYQTPLSAGAGVALVSLRTDKSSFFQNNSKRRQRNVSN